MDLKLNLEILFNNIKKVKVKELKNSILFCLDWITEPSRVRASIVFVQIEPTKKCNLSCNFCDRSLERDKTEELSLEDFKVIVEKMPFLQKISLVGVGEPLLNNNLFEMITYAKSKNIRIGFATNGTLLNDDVDRDIISSGVDWVNISLDGATKETFEKIRNGAIFEKIIENIKRLAEMLRERRGPELSIWFLAVRQNIHELNDLVLLAKKIGIKKVTIQTVHYWGKDIWMNKIKSEGITNCLNDTKLLFLNAKVIAKINNISLDYVNIPDINTERNCKWPWRASYITADGFVTPCCIHGTDPRIINFGNIFKDEFITIWNNIRYQNFRRQLKSEFIPSICVGCPSYYRKIAI